MRYPYSPSITSWLLLYWHIDFADGQPRYACNLQVRRYLVSYWQWLRANI